MRYDDISAGHGATAAEARAAYDLDTPDLDPVDLDEVIRLLDEVWGREVGRIWLNGGNSFLEMAAEPSPGCAPCSRGHAPPHPDPVGPDQLVRRSRASATVVPPEPSASGPAWLSRRR